MLYNLYRELRRSLDPREYDALGRERRRSVDNAFRERLRRDRDNYDRNVEHGVRRIDCLGELRRFVGLRPAVGSEVPYGRRREEMLVVQLAPIR